MNKNTLKILSFAAGIVLASLALIGIIFQIVQMINIFQSGVFKNDTKYASYYIITLIKSFITLAFYGFLSYKIIMNYINKNDESKTLIMPAAIYCATGLLGYIIATIFWGLGDTTIIYSMLLAASLVLIILSQFSNMDEKIKKIFAVIGVGICALLEFISIFNASGIGILLCLLYIAFFVLEFLYYLFDLLNFNSNIVEVEE